MNAFRHPQRGEGKIGCIISLLILIVATAVGIKAIPVFWTNNELKDAAKDLATRASVSPVESIEVQLRTKAKELDVFEAAAKGAIHVSKRGDGQQGICYIQMRYERKIDLYGLYTWPVVTDVEITAPYIGGM